MKNIAYSEEINDLNHEMRHYFAAANTCKGFVSFFPEIFDPAALHKIYILKGGPGVGKSTLMKKAARLAKERGFDPVCYHCSSDPSSLDGVWIPETGKAILDGTAPHVVDPRFAGAREVIVNLGEAWNLAALEKEDERILALCTAKSGCYRTAYRLLAAAKNADDELKDLGGACLDRQKMRAAIGRLCGRHLRHCAGGGVTHAVADAISCDGTVRFFTPEKRAGTLYFVKDVKNTASIFFAELYDAARHMGASVQAGVLPLDPAQIAFVVFPEASVCISRYDDAFCRSLDKAERPYKIINLGRFFDAEVFRACRGKYRFTEKCREALCAAAVEELAQAGALHAKLEEIYGAATDYKKVTRMSDKVIAEVLR